MTHSGFILNEEYVAVTPFLWNVKILVCSKILRQGTCSLKDIALIRKNDVFKSIKLFSLIQGNL
jgi:hypothetical protein